MRFIHCFVLAAALGAGAANAAEDAPPPKRSHAGHKKPAMPVVSATFDTTGRLWRAQVRDGRLLVSSSSDLGATYGPEVAVHREPQKIWNDGENRPKIAVDVQGRVHVSYTQMLEERMAGHVRYARSIDGGKSFSEPVIVNDHQEAVSHRFDAVLPDGKGGAWVAWLDKRDQVVAHAEGRPYVGAALYYAHTRDGEVFGPNVKVADHTCECCRVSLALDVDGTPLAFWRHVFAGNLRDHAVTRLAPGSAVQRVAEDGWQLDGCPHHGPSMAVGPDGRQHFAWYTGASDKPALAYASRTREAGVFSSPMRFANADAQPSRPHVLAVAGSVYVVWKEFDGHSTRVMLRRSPDGGRRWYWPRRIAQTGGASDHPFLLMRGREVFLSWSAEAEGHRLLELGSAR